ncbi:hypothetical protein FAM09_15800 [Niastella caeni]|uniref:Uncharacterized protein n=1 Tax=Niastella caeni TaxID=2569763 RepID=A0A4V4H0W7_9BACT|nr:hypothetical protein FAM09_15800 [Niastella caeni]
MLMLAKLFKDVMADNKEFVNVLTDVTGQYNRVIMVSKFDSLSAFDKSWEEMGKAFVLFSFTLQDLYISFCSMHANPLPIFYQFSGIFYPHHCW